MHPLKLTSLVLCTFTFVNAKGKTNCPFNRNDCSCEEDQTEQYDFDRVTCESEELPSLSDEFGTFTVRLMTIRSEHTFELPNNYFAPFDSIDNLELIQSGTQSPVEQNFQRDAFYGVRITSITFQGLDGILPPSQVISKLGRSGLAGLFVSNHGPINLTNGIFDDFRSLSTLQIEKTPILDIGPNVFAQILYQLKRLTIRDAGITSDMFRLTLQSQYGPPELTLLDLSGNGMNDLPVASFQYRSLRTLDLSENPIARDIEQGALDTLPLSLQTLRLANVNMTEVSARLFKNAGSAILDLSSNYLTAVRSGDFVGATRLQQLLLDDNPIDLLEDGAFQDASNVKFISLKRTKLRNVDLSMLARIGSEMAEVHLDGNEMLEDVGASGNPVTVPMDFTVHLRNTSLQTISTNVKVLLDSSPSMRLDISMSSNLRCKTLEWIAPYVGDRKQVIAHEAFCPDQDGMPFEMYLRTIDDSTVFPTTITIVTTAAHSTTTSKGSANTVTGYVVILAVYVGVKFTRQEHVGP